MMEEKDNNEQDIVIQQFESDKADAIKAIKKFADEEEDKVEEVTWKSVLGGDLLQSRFLMKQVIFVMFIAVLMLLYTGNRYCGQQDAILIDSLNVSLQTERYNVLTQSSELLYKSRQSVIEEKLKQNGDSLINNQGVPPFKIEN